MLQAPPRSATLHTLPTARRAQPTAHAINIERLHTAERTARQEGESKGFRNGYVRGARSGRVAGLVWGLLIGAGLVLIAAKTGLLKGP
jgi:hypothetical protein